MESERFQQALRRLEAVVERLERLPATPTTQPDSRLTSLEERHRKLRDGATEALARLDRLIGGSQGGAD